ncbi:MAG: enoyl-CoA hydratase-related protein [Pseudomonadota bacterium]|uniref:2-(1,2-epoxy-1,2-dihydrophenyl)acetyl-CoA isomerase PaaG n=2 Tax=Pseudomonadota TaxID=1224 RepID=A0ABY6MS54_9BURK|nr:enoyl-CoA hydratase-related protein [Schlegelella aquatica]UZD54848.1 2-(1,2-epoxy-1,2-dihydrophenyl)acetyl-CoA isomerase PaaG [Schlegelella aquatica]
MSEPLVLVSQEGAVRTFTLNRPAALNSFTGEMHEALASALDAAAADTAVRCVVITGAGRGFCAGQDLSDPAVSVEPGSAPKDLGAVIERHWRPLAQRLRSMPVPTVAAVNGVAAGAGANLALNCDLVVAARTASFIQAFAKIGLVPDTGGTWLLPHLVGRARALGLALLGDKLPAEEAARIGLIWQCVDDAALAETVAALAARLAAMPTRALVATRAAIDAAAGSSMDEALGLETRWQRTLGRAHDYLEGVAAFGAKRPPVFTDRDVTVRGPDDEGAAH